MGFGISCSCASHNNFTFAKHIPTRLSWLSYSQQPHAHTEGSGLQTVLDLLGKPLLLLDEHGTVRFANQAAAAHFQSHQETLKKRRLHDVLPHHLVNDLHDHIPQLMAQGHSRCWRYAHKERRYEVCIAPLEHVDDPDVAFALITHDITEQEFLEHELSKTRRSLEILNRCNQVLIHADNEAQLLTEICQAIVENGGYSLAWIGLAEQDIERRVHPVAHFGFDEGYLEQLKVSWSDNELGRGPVGTSIRNNLPVVIKNIEDDASFMPWREQALQRGYQSVASLPLRENDNVIGALAIYAPEPNAFGTQEISLLSELVFNLAHGIRSLRQACELRKLMLAVEQSPVSVMITDKHGKIEYVNPRFTKVSGYSSDEVRGKNPRLLKSSHISSALYDDLWKTISSGHIWQGELQNRSKQGRLFIEYATISPVINSHGEITHYMAVKEDITERKAFEERLWQQTNFDPLTKLPNRALLLDRLDQAMARAHREKTRIALLLIDLDNFKTVNDSLGHEVGDVFLLQVAKRLQSLVREGDTLARIGGDEFALILSHADTLYELEESAEKILHSLTPALEIDGNDLFVSASIGIALHPQDGATSGELLKNADAAMYRAKGSGRGTYRFFTPELNHQLEQRLLLETRLRGALERKELSVYYQPQTDCSEGIVVGNEALLRWHSPELGTIQPDHFIPLAEESGLIIEIGRWVLEQACIEARRWHDAGYPHLHVSVNLSLRQFQHHGLVASVRKALNDSGLPPRALELEVTETILMKDVDHVAETLRQLKTLGVKLALDDFGTGYSSLSYLKRFPFDALKIDRAFVRDVITNQDDAALCEAIIAMGQRLKLKVIAEGVETEEQYIYLCSRGADLLQGYYFGRAVSGEEFRARLPSLIP